MLVYQNKIFAMQSHVGYVTTRHFHHYGIVNSGTTRIVIGPTRQTEESEQELRELAFRADVPPDDLKDFVTGMKSIVRMPVESVLQILCTLNHVLNGEKLSLKDIAIYDAEQEQMIRLQEQQQAAQKLSSPTESAQSLHNTYDLEQEMLRIVRKGDTAALREWIAHAPAIRSGILAKDQLRQRKNIFLVSVTLISRAAIQGGMEAEEAFSLSDSYIQHCELLTTLENITNLQYRMISDYTERVQRLQRGSCTSKLMIDVVNYIRHHISEPITVEKMAEALFMSRPYLSRKFKEETGESLTDFILYEKTEEAKRLLRYSDKPITAISSYLGFSSPSHFSRVFKARVCITPGEYRKSTSDPAGLYFACAPSGKMILFTKKKITMEMPPLSTVVPML